MKALLLSTALSAVLISTPLWADTISNEASSLRSQDAQQMQQRARLNEAEVEQALSQRESRADASKEQARERKQERAQDGEGEQNRHTYRHMGNNSSGMGASRAGGAQGAGGGRNR